MKISTVPFLSIQTEGVNVGRPSVFLDLTRTERATDKTTEELVMMITRFNLSRIVYMGDGTLKQMDDIMEVAKRLSLKGFYQEIEIDGSATPSKSIQFYVDFFSISLKLQSTVNMSFYANVENLRNWLFGMDVKKYQMKFMIDVGNIRKDVENMTYAINKIELPAGANIIIQAVVPSENMRLVNFLLADEWVPFLSKYNWRCLKSQG